MKSADTAEKFGNSRSRLNAGNTVPWSMNIQGWGTTCQVFGTVHTLVPVKCHSDVSSAVTTQFILFHLT